VNPWSRGYLRRQLRHLSNPCMGSGVGCSKILDPETNLGEFWATLRTDVHWNQSHTLRLPPVRIYRETDSKGVANCNAAIEVCTVVAKVAIRVCPTAPLSVACVDAPDSLFQEYVASRSVDCDAVKGKVLKGVAETNKILQEICAKSSLYNSPYSSMQ